MKALHSLPILGVIALLSVADVNAARGVLHADGILQTKGASEGTSRVTVMPHDAPAYSLPQGTSRFVLNLELDNTFLVTFEQEGYVTKQLYFDTTVPVEYHAGTFDFPFKVTLEDHGGTRAFTYAGPVGYIRYQHNIADFGYETDYAMTVDESFMERMSVLRTTGSDPRAVARVPLVASVVTRGYTRPEDDPSTSVVTRSEGVSAPIVSEVPRLVHRISRVSAATDEPLFVSASVETAVDNGVAAVAETATRVHTPVSTGEGFKGDRNVSVPIKGAPAPLSDRVVTTAIEPAPHGLSNASGREEELFVEPTRVIKVVRILHPEGNATEYRRVVHRYGAVFFFKDGQSVPEHVFNTGTSSDQNL